MKESRTKGVRLQKWLADAGLCSRREGERWIDAGRVAVNGAVVQQQGVMVQDGDRVSVDNNPVEQALRPSVLIMLNKPLGVLCTRKDPEGRRTVFDLLPKDLPRLFTIGRLDINSEGLILLTNHGRLTHALTHPSRQVPRVYRVRARGIDPKDALPFLQKGVELEDGPTGPLDVKLDGGDGSNHWYTITVREGRNRLIRRAFNLAGLEVSRLLRVSYGSMELGTLQKGGWRLVTPEEFYDLREVAGLTVPTKSRKPGEITVSRKGSHSKFKKNDYKSGGKPVSKKFGKKQTMRKKGRTK
ncbi:MAG: rRNA pseudouridine synthase [Magnetococcales bacterium]|nr:rRNA pseudouridine synthase [Magnetococcales bacterium]